MLHSYLGSIVDTGLFNKIIQWKWKKEKRKEKNTSLLVCSTECGPNAAASSGNKLTHAAVHWECHFFFLLRKSTFKNDILYKHVILFTSKNIIIRTGIGIFLNNVPYSSFCFKSQSAVHKTIKKSLQVTTRLSQGNITRLSACAFQQFTRRQQLIWREKKKRDIFRAETEERFAFTRFIVSGKPLCPFKVVLFGILSALMPSIFECASKTFHFCRIRVFVSNKELWVQALCPGSGKKKGCCLWDMKPNPCKCHKQR